MADKATIEKRAEKYKKTEPLRKGVFAASIACLTLIPLVVKKGLSSNNLINFQNLLN